MAKSKTFHCTVITPERQVLDCEATSVVLPAHDGEIGILAHRAPLMCQLGIGVMRVETEGKTHRYFIDGGFAQMVHNRLAVLTEHSAEQKEIDIEAAQTALRNARAMTGKSDEAREARRLAVARASAKLKTVRA